MNENTSSGEYHTQHYLGLINLKQIVIVIRRRDSGARLPGFKPQLLHLLVLGLDLHVN